MILFLSLCSRVGGNANFSFLIYKFNPLFNAGGFSLVSLLR